MYFHQRNNNIYLFYKIYELLELDYKSSIIAVLQRQHFACSFICSITCVCRSAELPLVQYITFNIIGPCICILTQSSGYFLSAIEG